jgi:stage V sporulation protein G
VDIDVKVHRIHRINNPARSLRAYADIEVNDLLLVKGVYVTDSKNGLFVSMPRRKGKDNVWYETVRTLSSELRDKISSVVLSAYEASIQVPNAQESVPCS